MAVGYGRRGRESGRRVSVIALALLIATGVLYLFVQERGEGALALRVPMRADVGDPGRPLAAEVLRENVEGRFDVSPEDAGAETVDRENPRGETFEDLSGLVVELMDDNVPRNGLRAVRRLTRVGRAAVPFLEPALQSRDIQQRQLAAHVLRVIGTPPSDVLLQVSVESLRADLPEGIGRTLLSRRPHGATVLLAEHSARARPWLVEGLGSGDQQQRYYCAYLLARAGEQEHLGAICTELMPHLLDNHVSGDAVYSAHGLFGLGPAVVPQLRRWRYGADEQMLQVFELIEMDLANPPGSSDEIARRGKLQNVTNLYFDPLLELDVGRPPLPSIR